MPEAWQTACSLAVGAAGMVLTQHCAAADVRSATARPPKPYAAAGFFAASLPAALVGAQVCAPLLLLTARPFMSALLCLSAQTLLFFLNKVKTRVLHEPLVLADTRLLPQVFAFPEMYFPFLPMKALAGSGLALALVLAFLLWFENSLPSLRRPAVQVCLLALASAPAVMLLLLSRGRLPRLGDALLRVYPVGHDARIDALNNGALTSVLMHLVCAGKMRRDGKDFLEDWNRRPAASGWPKSFESAVFGDASVVHASRPPHVVLIQAESFCDVRRHLSGRQKEALADFLPNWDRLKRMDRILPTPEDAFGAYTMRMEFAALTGLSEKTLGPWAYNPYILAAKRPMWSLARHFVQAGYAAVCMHPYHKRFFGRDKVMPKLGFEEFHAFPELETLWRFGPYVADAALGKAVRQRIDDSKKPVFCFCITMEAHGPWLKGRLSDERIASVLADVDYGLFSKQVQTYLCHLRHMDRLFGMFLETETDATPKKRETLLWAYSDHAPGLQFQAQSS